jgi:hypothetical protein
MKNRDDLEGDLVRLAYELHEASIGGIGESNMNRLRPLWAEMNHVLDAAETMRPRLVSGGVRGKNHSLNNSTNKRA